MTNPNTWTTNATEVGVSDCDPDKLNANLEYLKYETDNISSSIESLKGREKLPTIANGTDAEHDLNISAGYAYDSTDSQFMELSAITKRFDAEFSAGTGNGAFATGESLPTSGTIHVWLISKADGTTDVFGNDHATSGLTPELPTGYTLKRRIASLRTDGSANLYAILQEGDSFFYKTPIADVSAATMSTANATNYTLSIPTGVKTTAKIDMYVSNVGGSEYIRLYCPDLNDVAVSVTTPVNANSGGSVAGLSQKMEILSNTSSQIAGRAYGSSTALTVNTAGYIDSRGRI
jgi:hypothetical protein